MMTHLPHVDMMAEAVELVESVPLLFLPYCVSSCQVNQKHYASGPSLVGQEGRLVTGSYTNGTPHLIIGYHLHSLGR
jgi:hypothetical protein